MSYQESSDQKIGVNSDVLPGNSPFETAQEPKYSEEQLRWYGYDGNPEEFDDYRRLNKYDEFPNPFGALIEVENAETRTAKPLVYSHITPVIENFIYNTAFKTGWLGSRNQLGLDEILSAHDFIGRYGLDKCSMVIKPYLTGDMEVYEPEEFKERGIRGGYLRTKIGEDGKPIRVPQAKHDNIGWIVTCHISFAASDGRGGKAQSPEHIIEIPYAELKRIIPEVN